MMKAELRNSNNDLIFNEEDDATYEFDKSSLYDNTSTRCPVVILVDTSKSMSFGKLYKGIKPIDEVNKGLNKLFDYIKSDYITKKRAEIAVISFSTNATLVSDFAPIETKKHSNLVASGQTIVAPALQLMLDLINKRKEQYKNMGRSYYRPICIMLTDGGPGDMKQFLDIKKKIFQASKDKELTFNAIKVGVEENIDNHKKHFDLLQGFDARIPAALLDVHKLDKFFEWLSKSIETRSRSSDLEDSSFADPTPWWKGQV
jgi:uncharacterized protein YegL